MAPYGMIIENQRSIRAGEGELMLTDDWKSPPWNHAATLMFVLTTTVALTVVPWYGFTHGYHLAAWIWFAVFLASNELAITCGYHRLFAHATYEASPALKIAYLLFGGMALQNSALCLLYTSPSPRDG